MTGRIVAFALLLVLNLSTRPTNVHGKGIPSVITAFTNNSITKMEETGNPPQCPSQIYCYGPLLHTIQMSKIFKDSKTFVDMTLIDTPENTLEKFDKFMSANNQNPSQEQIREFVYANFLERGSEFQPFTPPDWKEKPRFLDLIKNPALKQWGSDLNTLWSTLSRKMTDDVKNNPEKYSIIYVPNHVVAPGGRFLEFYYWDSYWIVRGLLYSEMYVTARGMLENFLHIIDVYGHIPNGGRVYYLARSQPPLLTGMVKAYIDFSKDYQFAINNVRLLEKEFQFFMDNHLVEVNGYKLYRYIEKSTGPRPESYREDFETASVFSTQEEKEDCYSELKAAAESGMDFSSRWFLDANGTNQGGLLSSKTRSIVPVDLNAILYWNAKLLSEFYSLARNIEKSQQYEEKAQEIYEAVQAVLWNEEDGIWYDYDTINKKPRKFFVPTNAAPLWTRCFDITKSQKISKSVVEYLVNKTKVDQYPGGVPNSLEPTGEQWDFPNAWAAMQYILIKGLENLNTNESRALAEKWAVRWVTSNHMAYLDEDDTGKHMYEKYDAEKFGGHGGGGEYGVQLGFGWSNGAALELLIQYGNKMSTEIDGTGNPPQCPSKIYCYGPLLHTVQMSKIFKDSKTFVDMTMIDSPENTLERFDKFMIANNHNPGQEQVKEFVNANFLERGSEFQPFNPPDWNESPRFLDLIKNPALKQWGSDLNTLWSTLSRKMTDDVKNNPEKYSIIYVPNHVVAPGGRFLEFYYWDSYWIVRGLLYSEMYVTARGMLENFLHIIDVYGHIPNGGRVYYLARSQPPLLTGMVKAYIDFSKDYQFAINNVGLLEKEFQFFMDNHAIEVNGYKLYRYIEKSIGPRPESYREDFETASVLSTEKEKEDLYSELKAAAESGMDFSSRWFMDENGTNKGGLLSLKTRYIVPVDLNAILYWNAKLLSEFYFLARNIEKAKQYEDKALEIYEAVQAVLWSEEDGIWYDYDTINKKPRKFFVPTNAAPLWTRCFDITKSQEISKSVVEYLVNKTKVDQYPGGVPNTLEPTGEQWDFPNAWAAMQYILIKGLENLNTNESRALAEKWAVRWVTSNHMAYLDEDETGKHMYEKYDAEKFGGHGGGGEYGVQLGFGWSNGAALELLIQYADKINKSPSIEVSPAIKMLLGIVTMIMTARLV